VLEQDGVIVGYYDLWITADEAHLLNIAVAAPERGKGFGGRLLDDALAEARAAACRRVFLEVRAGNVGAKKLYASRGFTRVGGRRKYYADGEDADIMVLTF